MKTVICVKQVLLESDGYHASLITRVVGAGEVPMMVVWRGEGGVTSVTKFFFFISLPKC
jgi:hypothetical protein